MAFTLSRLLERFPKIQTLANGSLVVSVEEALSIARWLRDDTEFAMDHASNVTGVDYLPKEVVEKKKQEDGTETSVKVSVPGYMEVVYHLYSMQHKHGPVVIRQRTENREEPRVASLTPIYRGAEFQEREVFDLYGIHFEGHPDQRRILMWDAFEGHPMRKDYVEPDDYEYEPTPHADVLGKAKKHYPAVENAL